MRLRTPIVIAAGLALAAATLTTPAFAGTRTVEAASCTPTDPSGHPVRLTVADNGRTICLLRNQRLSVALLASPALPPAQGWSTIVSSSRAVATLPAPPPANGVTFGEFRGATPGRAELRSVWNPCPPPVPGQPQCTRPVRLWSVTVKVSRSKK